MNSMHALGKVEQARWWALNQQPFYGSLAMRLADVADFSTKSASTDGRVIRWNPDYLGTLDDEEVRYVLLHETLHCAHLHMWRLPATKEGNEAGDYAINLVLESIEGIRAPKGVLVDHAYAGMAEEDIYAARKAPEQQPQDEQQDEQQPEAGDDDQQGSGGAGDGQGDGDGQGEGDGAGAGSGDGDPCGSFSAPAPDNSAAGQAQAAQESKDLQDSWERAVMQAAQVAQALGRGDLPGDLTMELERMRATRIDWRQELAEFIRDKVSARNDWTRSSRRNAWQKAIMPRRRQDDVGLVVAVRDTSGSIGPATVAMFNDMLAQCAAETGAELLVIDCDRNVQAEYRIAQGDELPQRAEGGGGTDFRPAFERVRKLAEEGEQIAGVVYLTDLDGPEPDVVDHATLWLSTTDRVARTGRTVRVV